MSIKGLRENSLFGLPPRDNGLCGLGETPTVLRRFLTTGDVTGVKTELSRFHNLPNHLQDIAQRLKTPDKFSLKVAKQYWLKEHNLKVLNSPGADNLAAVNLCLIRSGRIISVQPKTISIDAFLLQQKENNLEIANNKQTVNYDHNLVGKLRVGQIVACHWGKVVRRITRKEEKDLIDSTIKAIRSI